MSDELQISATASDLVDKYNSLIFIINSEIKKLNTADLVKVIAVNNDGTIDVQPLLGSVKADGSMNEPSPVYGVRYFQWQFGLNKIKALPVVGDIGLIICCKRDISNVENGNVGSFRQFSLADGIYIGGIEGLNQNPTQSIEFGDNALTITGTGTININAPTVNVNATTKATVISPEVELGGTGGQGVATVGKKVTVDGTPAGTTVGFIAEGSLVVKST